MYLNEAQEQRALFQWSGLTLTLDVFKCCRLF